MRRVYLPQKIKILQITFVVVMTTFMLVANLLPWASNKFKKNKKGK